MASSSSTSVEATQPWEELPSDITAAILQRLGAVEILTTAHKLCTTWRRVCQDPSVWRCIDMGYSPGILRFKLKKMCRHAVDLSRGQLIDISIDYFATLELLLYISQRSSQLRRLRLTNCFIIRVDFATETIEKFPLLEELHLQSTSTDVGAIEILGRSCPLLKSFKLNYDVFERYGACDMEALAIAENMPGLRHLELFGNEMTNVGLKAILDCCPNLESLDIRQCGNVDLSGDLGKLCSKRIN